MWQSRYAALLGLLVLFPQGSSEAAEGENGKVLLAKNCARCHALVDGESSPLKDAPNLWTVLRSYSSERLEFELSEGIGSRHKGMPQIQFSSEEIEKIENYLAGQ